MLMLEKPLFSVIMANYNNSQYIENAVKSLVSQTYSHWELIIVDDCSSDNSISVIKDIIAKHQAFRITLVVNPKNMGVGYTKNRCLSLTEGDLIGILDPDDVLEQCAIELMVKHHLKNDSASLIYSDCYICDEHMLIQHIAHVDQIPKGQTMLESWEKPQYSVSHFTTFKKQFYDRTAGFDRYMRIAEDKDLYYKMEEVGSLLHVDDVLYKYRIHSRGLSNGKTAVYNSHWHFYALIQGFERRGLDFQPMAHRFTQLHYVENTFEYKVGKLLLAPLKKLAKIIKASR